MALKSGLKAFFKPLNGWFKEEEGRIIHWGIGNSVFSKMKMGR
jgi:hypothetical protein